MKFWLVLALLIAGPAFGQEKLAVDPSENVKALNEAAQKRQDDLRAAEGVLNEVRYATLKEMIALRADYEDKLRRAEASRLDAIRLVDTTNLSVDRERAAATAQALQKKGDDSALVLSAAVVKSADDVRNIVKTTADEQARNLATQLGGIQAQFTDIGKRLTLLEQTGAEGIGKQKFQDPVQAALVEEVRKLSRLQGDAAGAGVGRGEILAGLGIVLTLLIAAYVAFRPSARR